MGVNKRNPKITNHLVRCKAIRDQQGLQWYLLRLSTTVAFLTLPGFLISESASSQMASNLDSSSTEFDPIQLPEQLSDNSQAQEPPVIAVTEELPKIRPETILFKQNNFDDFSLELDPIQLPNPTMNYGVNQQYNTKPAVIAQTEQPSITTDNKPTANQPLEEPTSVAKPQRNYSVTTESYYYNWSNNFGNSGSQFVLPVTFTFQQDNFDVGLRSAYINSDFDGVLVLDGEVIGKRKGSVSTISDTSLSLAYTFKQSSWPIRLNLDFNLPTGKATLIGDEKNAIMDGSLVQQTRFGEGFNIAPGISISHAFTNKDVVGIGVSHIFRGQFDPNGDVINDDINPGNETVASLQYQHSENNWLFLGGLIYTNYGVTQRGGLDYYRSGDRLDANATLVFAPFPRHRVQLSGRYFTQAPNDVVNFFSGNLDQESANSNGNALFLGFDWGVALDKQQKHTVRLLADYLTVEANSYDRINDLFNAGRNKFSIGLGYDYNLSRNTRFSVQAKYFNLTENATPITQRDVESDGINLYGMMNFSF